MKAEAQRLIEALGQKTPALIPLLEELKEACELLIDSFDQGGWLLLCGNGGSAADCEHIAGELLKGFLLKRPIPLEDQQQILCANEQDEALKSALSRLQLGLPALPLVSQSALSTAITNDLGGDLIFSQQVLALGRPGDVLLGISTSGNAQNVYLAMQLARGLGMKTIALTGATGGRLKAVADVCLAVPAIATPDVQELHLPLYHTLCAALERHYFSE